MMVWSRHHLPPNQILVNNHTIIYKAYTKHSYAMLFYQHGNGTKNHVNNCVHYLATAFVSYRPGKGCKLKITYNLKLESARIKKISILHHRGFCKMKFTLQMLEMKVGTTNMPVHQHVPQLLSPEDINTLVNVIKITEPSKWT